MHDSFVNAFFEYQLYLENIVRSLFRPAGVYHKNTTFPTGHFSPEKPVQFTGVCLLGSETAQYAHSGSDINPKILKNLSFLVFTIEMCATHTTHTHTPSPPEGI